MMLSDSFRSSLIAFGTWLLGFTFMMAAGLKAMDLASFSAQIARYNLVQPRWIAPSAILIVISEAGLGLACVFGMRSRFVLWGMLLLLALFAGATALRWNVLQNTDCNCFGNLFGGGPASVMLHDLLLGSVAGLVLAVMGSDQGRVSFRWLRVACAFVAISAGLFIAQPPATGYAFLSTTQAGDHIRVFLSANCKHCQDSLGKVEQLALAPGFPPVRVFIGADYEQQIAEFLRDTSPALEYAPVTFGQLGSIVPRVPTVQFLHDGRVQEEWSPEVPSVEQVSAALNYAASVPQ